MVKKASQIEIYEAEYFVKPLNKFEKELNKIHNLNTEIKYECKEF